MSHLRVPLLLALVLVGWPQERPKEKQHKASTPADVFSVLSAHDEPCPREQDLAELGLVKKGSDVWSLIDQSGELRVFYYASSKKMWLRFWPAPLNTSSATVLTALLNARNTSVSLNGPDEISVQLSEEESWLRFSLADGKWVGTDARVMCK